MLLFISLLHIANLYGGDDQQQNGGDNNSHQADDDGRMTFKIPNMGGQVIIPLSYNTTTLLYNPIETDGKICIY